MENKMEITQKSSGCRYILTTGKNKGTPCGITKIYCNNHCSRHHKISIDANMKKYGNYGNPDQANLWLKWINDSKS